MSSVKSTLVPKSGQMRGEAERFGKGFQKEWGPGALWNIQGNIQM